MECSRLYAAVEPPAAMAEDEEETFISDVLDAYRSVAGESPLEASTFKFYQMAVMLAPEASQ